MNRLTKVNKTPSSIKSCHRSPHSLESTLNRGATLYYPLYNSVGDSHAVLCGGATIGTIAMYWAVAFDHLWVFASLQIEHGIL